MAGALAITNDEFYVPIEASVGNPNASRGGRAGPKICLVVCRGIAKDKLTSRLKLMTDYETIFLTDEEMGITEEAMGRGMETLDPSDWAMYRYKFRESISKGLDGIHINFFGALRRGMNNTLSMFVWNFPSVYGPEHTGRVQSTIQACRDVAPKCLSSEMAKRFNNIISQLSSVSPDVRKAMKHYLFI